MHDDSAEIRFNPTRNRPRDHYRIQQRPSRIEFEKKVRGERKPWEVFHLESLSVIFTHIDRRECEKVFARLCDEAARAPGIGRSYGERMRLREARA